METFIGKKRKTLTDEWEKQEIKEHRDFAVLTAEISKATFGMTPAEYKNFKDLPKKTNAMMSLN